jgi:hypothetical protein
LLGLVRLGRWFLKTDHDVALKSHFKFDFRVFSEKDGELRLNSDILNRYFAYNPIIFLFEKFKRDKSRIPGYHLQVVITSCSAKK